MDLVYQLASTIRTRFLILGHTFERKYFKTIFSQLTLPLIFHLKFRARPQYASTNFALLTTFPSKELTEDGQTIDKAGLLNASILQRLQ